MEGVAFLGQILEEKSADVPAAVAAFSERRAPNASALVTISRNMDRPGKMFFLCFILPLILDGIFHKLAPAVSGPSIFKMFQRRDVTFRQIQRIKRTDRVLQVAIICGTAAAAVRGAFAAVGAVASATRRIRAVVSAGAAAVLAAGAVLQKM